MERIFSNSQFKITSKRYNIKKIATDQGDNHTIGCLLDYPYFNKIIAYFNKIIA